MTNESNATETFQSGIGKSRKLATSIRNAGNGSKLIDPVENRRK